MQIIQFVIDISLVYYGSKSMILSTYITPDTSDYFRAYEHFVSNYYQYLPHSGDCAGDEGAALFGCALLTSYLGLFIKFYFQTYNKKPISKKPNSVATGHVNGHAIELNTTT